jgi:sugar O-acyltransferase (sialic acid O-acetyltransferase NeuD family)
MKRLAIIGSGDLALQIAHYALSDNKLVPVGFFDDFENIGSIKNNYPILGKLCEIQQAYELGLFDYLMVGIGYNHMDKRADIFNYFKNIEIPFATIIHSSCFIDKSSRIAEGVFMYPGCIIDMNVIIEENAIINLGTIVSHDSIIGSHSFISPGVNVAGFVKIGSKVNLGIGSCVIDNITIGDSVRTGAGAIITNNLLVAGLYIGTPAKKK